MKNKLFIPFLTFALFAGTVGCTDLEQDVITTLNYKQVSESYEYVKNLQAGVYSYIRDGFTPLDGSMFASATDDAEFTRETSTVQKFNVGSWNQYDNPDDVWSHYFKGIRSANLFLASTDSINLDLYKYDPTPSQQDVYNSRLAEIENWKYEVRFLRAYYYFELIKRYGGVPIMTEAESIEKDYASIPRNSLAQCIDFITAECDIVASSLPEVYSQGDDLGRATKGSVLALKSRLLLYAASDLFNMPSAWAPNYSQPELISVTGNRMDKWQAAADAAKAVISLGGANYQLSGDFSSIFGSNGYLNQEVIFRKGNFNSNYFEIASTPVGYDLGESGTTPSQNLVDQFEVKLNDNTSVAFDWNNPDHAANPYQNRDPRLGYTVLTNNTVIKGRPIEAWVGGLDGKPKDRATNTGYYLKKYVNTDLDLLQGRTSNHAWVIFRLAEMYLNYAEALNEINPGNIDIKIYVDRVRQRNGVNMPTLPIGLSQDEMRNAIRHERRVEFAFENQRFWDVRRWLMGVTDFNVPLRGVEISKVANNQFNYKSINVEDRVFEPKMYFYPIPERELAIAKNWIQNPMW